MSTAHHTYEELREIAEGLLIGAGAIQECREHEVLINARSRRALLRAYRLGSEGITSGSIKLPPECTRGDFADLIREVYDEALAECRYCRKVAHSG